MTDTEPEVSLRFVEMIMSRSAEERFMMGIRSFEAARAMVIASLPKDLTQKELGRRIFERMYGAPVEAFVNHAALEANENRP